MIQDTQQQLTQITATQQKLKHQQEKLLQAHYEGAIPVELLRKEAPHHSQPDHRQPPYPGPGTGPRRQRRAS